MDGGLGGAQSTDQGRREHLLVGLSRISHWADIDGAVEILEAGCCVEVLGVRLESVLSSLLCREREVTFHRIVVRGGGRHGLVSGLEVLWTLASGHFI